MLWDLLSTLVVGAVFVVCVALSTRLDGQPRPGVFASMARGAGMIAMGVFGIRLISLAASVVGFRSPFWLDVVAGLALVIAVVNWRGKKFNAATAETAASPESDQD